MNNSHTLYSARYAVDVIDDPVKYAITVHSGRLEYLKQVLTLSSAGLAGTAFFYRDTTKLPTDFSERVALGITTILLAVSLVYSLFGLAVYANLLRVIDRESNAPPASAAVNPANLRSAKYARSLVNHAQGVLIALGFVGFGFVVFAGIRLTSGLSSTPEAAIDEARQLISKQTNHKIDTVNLELFKAQGEKYSISFRISPENLMYAVSVNKSDGRIEELRHESEIQR